MRERHTAADLAEIDRLLSGGDPDFWEDDSGSDFPDPLPADEAYAVAQIQKRHGLPTGETSVQSYLKRNGRL